MINKDNLAKLVVKTKEMIAEKSLEEMLTEFPQSLLVIRLSIGKSQREFIKLVRNRITHPILIKHENGKTKKMTRQLAKKLSQILSKLNIRIDDKTVIENFEKFKEMQKGHLTSEIARKLQKKWLMKTSTEQRKRWGKLGALKALSKIRLTKSELGVKKILEELGVSHKIHEFVEIDEKLSLNVDFLIENPKKVIIEVTEKQNNLTITAQSIAFRALEIKNKNPNLIFISITSPNMSLMGREVLKRTCDEVFTTNQMPKLKEFLTHLFHLT
jgi:hypothetical protein